MNYVKKRIMFIVMILLSVIILIVLNGAFFLIFGQYRAIEKLKSGKDLNLYECCTVYSIHIGIWSMGWPMSPEAAKECFLLHFPQKDTVDFKRCRFDSPKLRAAIAALEGAPVGSSIRLSWRAKECYSVKSKERRIAIAVNPCTVSKVAEGKYQLISEMEYPEFSKTPFNLGLFTIELEEGLFRHLQDRGWLNRFVAVYNVE